MPMSLTHSAIHLICVCCINASNNVLVTLLILHKISFIFSFFFHFLEILPKILAYTEVEGEKLSIVYSYSNGLLK